MEIQDLKNKKVAILGLKVEGVALAQFLKDKVADLAVFDMAKEDKIVSDYPLENKEDVLEIFSNQAIAKNLGDHYLDDILNYDVIFRSPAFHINHEKLLEARQKGIEISSQIKLFFDLCPCKIIGVTGTKGKGTTASLIYSIISLQVTSHESRVTSQRNVYLAGNIGYPAITLIPKLKKDDLVVLELSNFQLFDLHRSPEIAVVTNLDVDHLDYHSDIAEYHDAKRSILSYQNKHDYAVLNLNSKFDSSFIASLKSQVLYFSADKSENAAAYIKEIDGRAGVFVKRGDSREEEVCFEDEIKLLGRHNLENIAAASIVGDILGVDISIISLAVKNTVGLPYRTELVAEINNVKYINDSFATNPRPTMAAISSFKNDKILILGGSSKGADFNEMAALIKKTNVTAIFLIGVEGKRIKEALALAGFSGEIFDGFSDLQSVVNQISQFAKPFDVVIFSPACASFDMFENYKDRGEKFKNAVLEFQSKVEKESI